VPSKNYQPLPLQENNVVVNQRIKNIARAAILDILINQTLKVETEIILDLIHKVYKMASIKLMHQ